MSLVSHRDAESLARGSRSRIRAHRPGVAGGALVGVLTRLARALERLFSGHGDQPPVCALRAFPIAVRCARCGEVIHLRIDRDHELQSVYAPDAAEGDEPVEYVLRKEIVGDLCQNLIRFTVHFDCDHGLISSEIEGGEFLDEPVEELWGVREERSESST